MNKLTIILILIAHSVNSQCGLKQSVAKDGSKLYSTFPKMVGHNNKDLQTGLSLESTENSDFLGLIVRFKEQASDIKGDLVLTLTNNSIITCKLIKQTQEYSGGSNCSIGVFLIGSQADFNMLGKYDLRKVKFDLENQSTQIIVVSMNPDCIKSIVQCLKSNRNTSNASTNKSTVNQNRTNKGVFNELENKNGFKDFNFDKSFKEISISHTLKFIREQNGESTFEVTDSDLSSINDVQIKKIQCYFVDDKLIRIGIELSSNSTIADLLIETFGQPTEGGKNPKSEIKVISIYEYYYWISTNIQLSYVVSKYGDKYDRSSAVEYKMNYQKIKYDEILIEAKKKFLQSKKNDL